jgi:hypothetical protein
MAERIISINRAPVLTLWAAVVAQRLGFDENEALTLGKALAGLNAQAKGRSLGIFKPHEEKAKKAREKERGERFLIEVLGRPVPATNTGDGIRAVQKGRPIDPDSARRYLDDKFEDNLGAVRKAMMKLAKAYKPQGTRPRRLPALRALSACHSRRCEGVECQRRPRPGADRAAGEGESVKVSGAFHATAWSKQCREKHASWRVFCSSLFRPL